MGILPDLWAIQLSKTEQTWERDWLQNINHRCQTTSYWRNLRAFYKEADNRRQLLESKLQFEGNNPNLLIYLEAIGAKILIRNLSSEFFFFLTYQDISDLRMLTNIAQNNMIYEEHTIVVINKYSTSNLDIRHILNHYSSIVIQTSTKPDNFNHSQILINDLLHTD